jgi:hypothetical protein
LASTSVYTSRESPAVTVTAPAMSHDGFDSSRLSSTIRGASRAAAMPIGVFTNSTHSQPAHSVSMPPASTPTAPPEPATAPQTASALLRSAPSANVVVRMARAAGEISAAPSPCTARAITSQMSLCARPPAREAIANSHIPKMKIRRRPSRSARRPPSSRKPPKKRVYAFTTQDRSSWAKSRSRPMDGSATFTIEASRTTTNCAVASSASAMFLDRIAPRLDCAPRCAVSFQ